MSDIVDELRKWEKQLADMDRGEFDNGIMTQIRFQQRDRLAKAADEIERLRGAEEGGDILREVERERWDKTRKAAANYLRLADAFIKEHIRDWPEYDAACLSLWDSPGFYDAMRNLQIEMSPPKKHFDGCDI